MIESVRMSSMKEKQDKRMNLFLVYVVIVWQRLFGITFV